MPANPNRLVDTLGCTKAREEIQVFAGAQMPAARARKLRVHLLQCPACNRMYRESVEVAASLGKNLRSSREDSEEEKAQLRREAYRSLDKLPRKKPNHSALRTILLPAFFFTLMVFVTKLVWPGDKVEVSEWHGAVFLGDDPFGSDGSPRPIRRGAWLRTGEGGSLDLKIGASRVRLAEHTFLLIEDASLHRFRFRGGDVRLEGPSLLTTNRGVVEVEEGVARVRAHGLRFELSCEAGEIAFLDASGEKRLAPGEQLLLGAD